MNTNQSSDGEVELAMAEVEGEEVGHVIGELRLHAAVARLALVTRSFS